MPGIHHVTGITANVQANVDFYGGLLGLRLVKRTVNHRDHNTLHLFYGDGGARPGTLLTFFAWPAGAKGRRGHGQAAEVGLVVPRSAIGYWTTRLVEHGVAFRGPTTEGGVTRLELADPDGLTVALVGVADAPAGFPSPSEVPADAQVRGLAHVTLWSERPDATGAVLEELLGFEGRASSGATTAYVAPVALGNTVYVRDVRGFWSGAEGAGVLHHVAFGVPDARGLAELADAARERGLELSDPREHGYFQSRYFREPGGSLIEVATEAPGLTLDEPPEELGRRLVLPPELERIREEIEVVLPPFALPGQPRPPERDLGWTYRLVPGTSGLTLLVLHGSGGSETQLLPMARRVAPAANLLAPRGRSRAEPALRYFARFPDGSFDQEEIDHEADALAELVADAAALHDLDPGRVVILGYSNGAHIGAASLARNPGSYAGAALLRTVAPFGLPASSDLAGKPVLMLQGEDDHLLREGADARLSSYLRANGADVELRTMPFGHYLGEADDAALQVWLERFS